MDWDAAIEKNREALKHILAMLVAMAGLELEELRGQFTFFRQKGRSGSGLARAEKSKLSPALTLPRRLHRAILRLLRPAEAAVRRLIVVAARGHRGFFRGVAAMHAVGRYYRQSPARRAPSHLLAKPAKPA